MSKETFSEQIERLELMATGYRHPGLSDKDRSAIRALLESYLECVGESLRRKRDADG